MKILAADQNAMADAPVTAADQPRGPTSSSTPRASVSRPPADSPRGVAPQTRAAALQTAAAAPRSQAIDPERRQDRKPPRTRTPSVPTPGQLAVFERALARRNAAKAAAAAGGTASTNASDERGRKRTPAPASRDSNLGSGSASAAQHASPASSMPLSELARAATTKRPLTRPELSRRSKLAVFAVGCGVAALLIGVLTFGLFRTSAEEPRPRATLASIQPFSPRAAPLVAEPAESPTPQSTAPSVPQQTAAPEDIRPPETQPATLDAVDPAPMLPRSMQNEPPLGMIALQSSN